MKLLYFAWLKSMTGAAEEDVDPPAEVKDVEGLIGWLRDRSPGHARAFENLAAIRVAVNQDFASLDRRIEVGDEIAFFPPMTGG